MSAETSTADPIAPDVMERAPTEKIPLKVGMFDVVFDEKGIPKSIVVARERRRKVALVGFSESTKHLVPYSDPSYEVWSLNQHYRFMPRASRWFEIHQRKDYLADMVKDTDYLGWLQRCQMPLYVTDLHADLPTAIPFPIEAFRDLAPIWEQDRATGLYRKREYMQSSLLYMLALAVMEDFDLISLYGIDLVVGKEYHYQKPNMEWFLGFAQGRGYEITRGSAPRGVPREIHIHRRSALLRQTYTYGPELTHPPNVLERVLKDRLAHLADSKDKLLASLHNCDGAINEAQQWLAMLDLFEKGGEAIWQFTDGHAETISPDGTYEPVKTDPGAKTT